MLRIYCPRPLGLTKSEPWTWRAKALAAVAGTLTHITLFVVLVLGLEEDDLFGTTLLLIVLGSWGGGSLVAIWLFDKLGPSERGGLLWRRRRLHRYEAGLCLERAYDLTGNVSGVCPECGTKIKRML